MGRATSGVRIIKLKTGDRVSDIAKLVKDKNVSKRLAANSYNKVKSYTWDNRVKNIMLDFKILRN